MPRTVLAYRGSREVKLKGILAMAAVILVWGVTFVNTRALLFDFSALEIQILRFAMAWAALCAVEKLKGKKLKLRVEVEELMSERPRNIFHFSFSIFHSLKDELLFAGMGLCGVFIYQLLENCAIYYTNASNVAILVSFGPVVTAVMARWAGRDGHAGRMPLQLWLGSAVAIAGVALISFNNAVTFELRPLGDLMALAAMLSWGCYSILIDKANAKGYPPLTAIRKAFGWALVMMIPLGLWGVTESGYTALDGSFSITLDAAANAARFREPMNWINLGFLGLLASAACFVLWNVACKAFGVVRTTIGLYFTPIVGVLFAAAFLGERVTGMSVAGGVLIIAGVAVTRGKWKMKNGKWKMENEK